MNRNELAAALILAQSDTELPSVLYTTLFNGFGLKDFEPVYVNIAQVAALIRYQCFYMFNNKHKDNYDHGAFQELAYHGRKKFIILDEAHAIKYLAKVIANKVETNS